MENPFLGLKKKCKFPKVRVGTIYKDTKKKGTSETTKVLAGRQINDLTN